MRLGTPLRNTLGTKEKWKNPPPPAPQKLKRKKQGTLSEGWAFPLAAWNFYSQNCLSPFSTFTNTPIINWGYLLFIQLRSYTQYQICKSVFYVLFPFHFCFYSSRFSSSCWKAPIKYSFFRRFSYQVVAGWTTQVGRLTLSPFFCNKTNGEIPLENVHKKRAKRGGGPHSDQSESDTLPSIGPATR